MSPRSRLVLGALLIGAASALGAARPAGAQGGVLTGVVVDSGGSPVLGAQVVVGQGSAFTETDEQGAFRLARLPAGTTTLSVKRLGFRPASVSVRVDASAPAKVSVTLARAAQPLSAVVVRGQHATTRYEGRIGEFYRRLEERNGGVFITRAEIDRQNPRFLTDMMRTVPGLQLRSTRRSTNSVRMRERTCAPLVWLDGIAMPSGETDLDTFPPSSIEGVEIYLGATTVPARYTWVRNKSSCGTILLWSRTRETYAASDNKQRGPRATAADLEAMVASLTVYTADQVDQPARADSAGVLVAYPASLFAEKTEGKVVAEFVVDSTGRVEPETFGVVSSSHPLFTEAVETAVAAARFVPARVGGRAVRQVVQQPFSFVVPSSRGRDGRE